MDDSFQWDDNYFNSGSEFEDFYQDVPYSPNFYDDIYNDVSQYINSSDAFYDNPFSINQGNTNYSIFQDPTNGYYSGGGVVPTTQNAGWGDGIGGSIKGVLNDLFTKGTTSNMVGQVGSALLSGYQNKKLSENMQQAASKLDPWASQRGFYQQQAKQAVTDPYSSPIVKAQIEQMQRAQDIKDAAAGRRSNQLTSSPALMAAMAQVALNYQNQMAQQGGAGINPSASATALSSAANADASGYISPMAQLFGYQTGSNTNQNTLEAALQQMATGKAT